MTKNTPNDLLERLQKRGMRCDAGVGEQYAE